MLQQNWYNDGNRYLKWVNTAKKSIFLTIDFAFFLFAPLTLFFNIEISLIVFFVLSVVMCYLERKKQKREQLKKPLVFTARVKRLSITTAILYLISIVLIVIWFMEENLWSYICILGIMAYLNWFLVYLSNIINKPVEKQVFYHYRRFAVRKLKQMNQMEVIGITGSYGKTSSKNILSDILNVKFDAFPTPKNFNTTYGLINTINNYLDKFTMYFIAEMGAFRRGEIKEICDLVHPKYGILTIIGTAHLESFGSRDNIQKGKFELIEALPSDGIGILNGDDPYQRSYDLKNKCKIVWIGIDEEADVRAVHIKLHSSGTSFDCQIKGDPNLYHFETRLLGKANIYNILAGIALGRELGLTVDELIRGVKRVNSVEHRLELKKYGAIHIIDDSYNSNPVGSKMALDVLKMMPGKHIAVTPGMIELGTEQYDANFQLGIYLAESCDDVILVGEKQTKPIYDGLKSVQYDEEHIHILQDVKLAFPLMQQLQGKETYVLLENDLPDIFNEK